MNSAPDQTTSLAPPAATQRGRLIASCAPGTAPVLESELCALGLPVIQSRQTSVETEGGWPEIFALNLQLRTAQRVLWEVGYGRVRTVDNLYSHVRRMPWERWIPADGYLTVTSFVHNPSLRDPRFATLRCKDAIVDRLRELHGRRPDSGNERSGAVVFLYWNEETAILYLDTSGETLSRRGYRKIPLEAPMQESLAAAVVMASGWTGQANFVNPMCGSGTLAIEAALLAIGRAPGLTRPGFAFEHLLGFDPLRWREARLAAAQAAPRAFSGRIIASDINPAAIAAARENARAAGVADRIEFSVCDFAETPIPEGGGLVLLNPEYGARMGDAATLEPLYRGIGDFFKQRCRGYLGGVFTGNLELGQRVGLRPRRRISFSSGGLDCRLFLFELYEGSKRTRIQATITHPVGDKGAGEKDVN